MIVFLDGDDRWAPGKLRKMTQVFGEDPALGMIGHAFIESFGDGARKTVAQYFARRMADAILEMFASFPILLAVDFR